MQRVLLPALSLAAFILMGCAGTKEGRRSAFLVESAVYRVTPKTPDIHGLVRTLSAHLPPLEAEAELGCFEALEGGPPEIREVAQEDLDPERAAPPPADRSGPRCLVARRFHPIGEDRLALQVTVYFDTPRRLLLPIELLARLLVERSLLAMTSAIWRTACKTGPSFDLQTPERRALPAQIGPEKP